jgi:S-adenosylmethionine:diacylglycerol 3-amino-3-carboxypropyl transferase
MKLAKHISVRLNKVEFKANELGSAYEYVLKNMMSVLPEKELQSLLTKIQKWISEGGKIVFIQKNK